MRRRKYVAALEDPDAFLLLAAAFRVLVIALNDDARRFYERRGLATVSHVLLGRVADA